jgi:MFS family permease
VRLALPAVLRDEPQFRLLFWSQLLSVLGDQITVVALPFAVLSIGGGLGDVGLVVAAGTLPFALFAILGGVWADRLPRHRVMLASDLVRLVTQGLMAGLLLSGAAEIWHLVALMAVFGTADAFFAPAMTGLTPAVVSTERLHEANALRGLLLSGGHTAGPALGGLLIVGLGTGGAIAVDAATFAVSAAALARMRPAVVERATEQVAGLLAGVRDGFAEVRARPWVQAFLGLLFAYHVVVLPAIFVLGPVLADREYGGAASWATVTASFGVGAVAGSLLIARLRPRRPMLVATLAMTVASCQAAFIGSGLPLGAIAALEAVAGVGVSTGFTLWETTLQEQIPEHAISRVSSYDFLLSAGMLPLGFAVAGPLAAAIGLHELLVLETLVGVPIALLVLTVPAIRRIERRALPQLSEPSRSQQ